MNLQSPFFLGINLYNFFWATAWIVGLGIFARLRAHRHFDVRQTFLMGVGIFISAIFGGRFFYFLNHPQRSVWETFSLNDGGLVFLGSLCAAVVFLVFWAKFIAKENIWELLDLLSWPLGPALFLGRLGCFFQGCCHGLPTAFHNFSVSYHSEFHSAAPLDMPLVPTQLIESAGVLGVILMQFLLRKRLHPAFVFASAYAVLRFFVEFYRGDLIRGMWGPFSPAQWFCFVWLLIAGAGQIFKVWRLKKA